MILFYVTALVTPGTGTIVFAEDIYATTRGSDRALAALGPSPGN